MTQDIDDDDRVTASASSNAEEEGEEMGKVFTEVSIQVLYCTVLYCTVLYCTVLYCTVHTVLYCAVHTGGGARHQDGQVQPGEGELQFQRLILQVEVKIKGE